MMLGAFMGGMGPVKTGLPNGTVGAVNLSFGSTGAAVTIRRDGLVVTDLFNADPGSSVVSNMPSQWANYPNPVVGDNFWMRATLLSGFLGTGTLNSWVQLNNNWSYQQYRGTGGTVTGQVLIQIASDPAGANVLTSFEFAISATSTFA